MIAMRVRSRKKRDTTMTERREGVIRMTMIPEGIMELRFHVQGRFGLVDLLLSNMDMDKFMYQMTAPKRCCKI